MSSISSMNDIVDKITLTSSTCASLPPTLADHISAILMQQDDQNLCRAWQTIFISPGTDRRISTLQAFDYHEPDQTFEFEFKAFIQSLLSAVWCQDQQAAFTLAGTLGACDSRVGEEEVPNLTRLDAILMNDAVINARTFPKRNPEVEQTYVDKYGLPAESGSGKEGQDYFYHDTEEVMFKLRFLRYWFDGDIVRWTERDWRDGLYGDPNDLSISGTNTAWAVQRQARMGQQARGSRGRLPGSYNEMEQTTILVDTDHSHDNLQETDTGFGDSAMRSIDGFQLPSVSLPVQTQGELSSVEIGLLSNDQDMIDQLRPRQADIESSEVSGPSHSVPVHARANHVVELMRSDKPVELSDRDRQLLEDYRRAFEVREEELHSRRRQQARERWLILTKSEEELARIQSTET